MRRAGYSAFAAFLFYNFILSLVIGAGYLRFADAHPASIFFSLIACVSNTFTLYIPLGAVSLVPYLASAGALVFVPVFGFAQFALALDLMIYTVFRLHINSMVINLLITPGGIETLGIGPETGALLAAIAAVLAGLEVWIYRAAVRPSPVDNAEPVKRGRWKLVLAALLAITLIEKSMCLAGAYYDNPHVTGNFGLFPMYRTLNAGIVRAWDGGGRGRPWRGPAADAHNRASRLSYPARTIDVHRPEKPLNILVIVLEAFRTDALNAEVTPNLLAFAKKATLFDRHYSGGNSTRFGIFSIFYGMYGNYWFPLLEARRAPVLMDVLRRQGYEVQVYSASALSYPEFRKTCFAGVARENVHDDFIPTGANRAIRDEFIAFLGRRDAVRAADKLSGEAGPAPYFAFLFFDASHSYTSPGEFRKFQPAYRDGSLNYLALGPSDRTALFNRYRNAVFFEDSLVGDILSVLERRGGLKDTVVLVTGDHGESFFEHGYLGHNRGYSEEEIKVPLMFYLPDRRPGVVSAPTSHMDIAPTLMRLAGARNPPEDYSGGTDLFAPAARSFIPAFSWDTAALIRDGHVVVMPSDIAQGGVCVFGRGYEKIQEKSAVLPFIPCLREFRREATRFYK
ncbi:MAG TPA: sulfatase-like hydrolase/transferase [Elusimicrobiales bacterium]|nr:sulfatase-like hydrolase/transferase [Elusimicrobiales bacterium]